ncbi:MAG: PHP domain-containing protein [Chloroflexota bacterium]
MIDLHLHSTWSDGRLSPTEVVQRAAEQGLTAIAIADHDVVGGTQEAVSEGRRRGVEVIPAVELTVRWGRRVVHLLGYGFDYTHPLIEAQFSAAERAMRVHVGMLLEELRDAGQDIPLSALQRAHSRYPTGTSVVLAITRARGLGRLPNPWQFLRRAAEQPATASIENGIALIHAAGGAAILAHPGKATRGKPLLEAHDLASLIGAGLDGIECWTVAHDDGVRNHFLDAADKLGLLTTGGSDSHGRDRGAAIGSQHVPISVLTELRKVMKRVQMPVATTSS